MHTNKYRYSQCIHTNKYMCISLKYTLFILMSWTPTFSLHDQTGLPPSWPLSHSWQDLSRSCCQVCFPSPCAPRWGKSWTHPPFYLPTFGVLAELQVGRTLGRSGPAPPPCSRQPARCAGLAGTWCATSQILLQIRLGLFSSASPVCNG